MRTGNQTEKDELSRVCSKCGITLKKLGLTNLLYCPNCGWDNRNEREKIIKDLKDQITDVLENHSLKRFVANDLINHIWSVIGEK